MEQTEMFGGVRPCVVYAQRTVLADEDGFYVMEWRAQAWGDRKRWRHWSQRCSDVADVEVVERATEPYWCRLITARGSSQLFDFYCNQFSKVLVQYEDL